MSFKREVTGTPLVGDSNVPEDSGTDSEEVDESFSLPTVNERLGM